jgi:hypothetical protein
MPDGVIGYTLQYETNDNKTCLRDLAARLDTRITGRPELGLTWCQFSYSALEMRCCVPDKFNPR